MLKVIRYILAGGTATLVNLILLYLFTDVFGWWYLVSTICSFSIGIFVSFILQKFWTFKDKKPYNHKQFMLYGGVSIVNTVINTGFMYAFVEFANIPYLISQIISAGLIAISSFTLYKRFIFTETVDVV